jgi:2-methylcitrate dehydratase PrpD
VAVADGQVTTRQFEHARILDPALRPVLGKIRVEVEPAFEALFPRLQPCEVTIRLTDGREFTDRMDYPMGDPRNPMSAKRMDDKFDALTEGLLSAGANAMVKAAIDDADCAPAITELMECFVCDLLPGPAGARAKRAARA